MIIVLPLGYRRRSSHKHQDIGDDDDIPLIVDCLLFLEKTYYAAFVNTTRDTAIRTYTVLVGTLPKNVVASMLPAR